jgi:hypothetical protein
MPDPAHDHHVTLGPELHPVVAGADAKLAGEWTAQGLGATDARPTFQAIKNAQDAAPDDQRE